MRAQGLLHWVRTCGKETYPVPAHVGMADLSSETQGDA